MLDGMDTPAAEVTRLPATGDQEPSPAEPVSAAAEAADLAAPATTPTRRQAGF
jgi:hypothetical protein